MWFEWMSPWWRDTVDVAVAVATVLATVGSGIAIVISLNEARKSRERLQRERRRLHDLDLIEDLLILMVERPGHNVAWSRAAVLRRMLSPRVQQWLPRMTAWSDSDVGSLVDELRDRHPDNPTRSPNDVGWMRVDERRNLYDVIFDELVEASHRLADEAD